MTFGEELAQLRAIAGKKNALEVLMLLREKKVVSPSEIALSLKLEASQVHRALKVLLVYGVVSKHEKAATPVQSWVFYSLSPIGRRVAQHMMNIRLALLHAVVNDTLTESRRGRL